MFVQNLPLKDTYTKAISCQWDRRRIISSQHKSWWQPLSKITSENKNKDKMQKAKADAASFSLAPSRWKCQSRALYLSFTSSVLFATCQKPTLSVEECECFGISLPAFPTIDTEDGTELDFHWQAGFENGELWSGRRKIIGKVGGFRIFIHPPQLFFFLLKSKAVWLWPHNQGFWWSSGKAGVWLVVHS